MKQKTKTKPLDRIRRTAMVLTLAACGVPMMSSAEDLSQIYQLARGADPTLAIADDNRNATQENVPQARAALLPQINGSIGYTHADGDSYGAVGSATPNPASVPSSTITRTRTRPEEIQLSQTLFNWADIERVRSAEASAEGADFTYDAASQDLLVRTATAYFGVLTAEDQFTFAQLNQKALQTQLDQAEQRFKVGLASITDVHVARAQRDTAAAQVISAQNTVETAREVVAQIIGKSFGDLKKLRDPVPLDKPEPPDMQAWVDMASKQNPALAAARKSVDASEFNVAQQRAGHYPTLTGTLTRANTPQWGSSTETFAGSSSSLFPSSALNNGTTIGVTLNIPIFSGGLVSAQTRQALFQRDAAQDQLDLDRRTVVANTRNAYRASIAGISEVEATKTAVISAESAVKASQAGYEVGTKTIIDVLSSQATLLQAQSTYSQARHQFVLSGLQLKQAAGVISIKDLQAVNSLLE